MPGHLSSCVGYLGILLKAWQGNRDASQGEAADPVSLACCHSDIEIPINFQVESGLINLGSIDLHLPLKLSQGYWSSCRDQGVTYRIL